MLQILAIAWASISIYDAITHGREAISTNTDYIVSAIFLAAMLVKDDK